MSAKSDQRIQRIRRGERVALIREALGMSGQEFATALRQYLQAVGVDRKYDKAKVSRIEGGGRELTAEEAAVVTIMDPERRSAYWLIFGDAARAETKALPGMFTDATPIATPKRRAKAASAANDRQGRRRGPAGPA